MGLSSSIDLAEILFTLFWLFFIGLIFYLRREDKREGYPLESDRSGNITVQGFPAMPPAKTYDVPNVGTVTVPRDDSNDNHIAGEPASAQPGAPLVPTGNPMHDRIGPGTWSMRRDAPDLTMDGKPRIIPMRSAEGFHVDKRDPNPIGMPVVGADKEIAGTVKDVWVDLGEPMIEYFEVALADEHGGRNVMVPLRFAKVHRRQRIIEVNAIYSHQFADVPALASDQQITCREEDKVCAYFGGGTMYADEKRQEPLV